MRRPRPVVALAGLAALTTPQLACAPTDTDAAAAMQEHAGPVHFVRYEMAGETSYGILDGPTITPIYGDIFGKHSLTNESVALASVTLLPPTDPEKVIAVGLNYLSHIGNAEPAAEPGLFAKYPTSLIGHEQDIITPQGASPLHFEGELVVVIGKTCSKVSKADALDCVFAVTAGNDVSERRWQRTDLQWLRAKGSDTFGPVGPSMVVGLDPDDLLVQTRVTGEVMQSERTSDLIFDVPTMISYISQYFTLKAGDMIFTGTPGSTRGMNPGDVVEIEVEGVGVLRNTVR